MYALNERIVSLFWTLSQFIVALTGTVNSNRLTRQCGARRDLLLASRSSSAVSGCTVQLGLGAFRPLAHLAAQGLNVTRH
jgi:hypothetical protein